jgi:hypothetical protein
MKQANPQPVWQKLSTVQRAQVTAMLVQLVLRHLRQERRPTDDPHIRQNRS